RGERQQLLVEWNDTRSEFPRETSIPQLFERQVERVPDAVAVVFEAAADRGPGERLSYRELNRRANQLAHHLRSLGVGPEVLTGIYLERSARTVVGILGILKAGGAYLPLDLSYPMERLSFMLEDAGAPVLITDAGLAATLPATLAERGVKVVCVDRDAPGIARRSDRNPDRVAAVGAENLAYAIYTSGST
ncbi:MAG: AMP-binding protein, partial [Deltaproteobacteria bacterium]|nr:AMP-binding protein [Deltaproteobacteria bacterium]